MCRATGLSCQEKRRSSCLSQPSLIKVVAGLMLKSKMAAAAIMLLLHTCINRGCETWRLRLHHISLLTMTETSPEPLSVVVMASRNFKASGKAQHFDAMIIQCVDPRLCPVLHLAGQLASLWSLPDCFRAIRCNAWTWQEVYSFEHQRSSSVWQPFWLQYRLFPRKNRSEKGPAEFVHLCDKVLRDDVNAQLAALPENERPSNCLHSTRNGGLQAAIAQGVSTQEQDRLGCWHSAIMTTRVTSYLQNTVNLDTLLRRSGRTPPEGCWSLVDKVIEPMHWPSLRKAIVGGIQYHEEMVARLEQGVFIGLDAAVEAAEQRRAAIANGTVPQITMVAADGREPGTRLLQDLELYNLEERRFLQAMVHLRGVFLAGLFHLLEKSAGGPPLPFLSQSPVLLQPDMQEFLRSRVLRLARADAEARMQAQEALLKSGLDKLGQTVMGIQASLQAEIASLRRSAKRPCAPPAILAAEEIPASDGPAMAPPVVQGPTRIVWVRNPASLQVIWLQWQGMKRHFVSMPPLPQSTSDNATYWKLQSSGPNAAQWEGQGKKGDAGKGFTVPFKAAIAYMEGLASRGEHPDRFLQGLQDVADDKPAIPGDPTSSSCCPACPICLSEMCMALNLIQRGQIQGKFVNGKQQRLRPVSSIREALARRLLFLGEPHPQSQ